MKTKTILSFLLLSFSQSINAQTDVDALRYSGGSITGTSRFTAMSGAFGAVGGDFTSLSYNPAGIAVYRSSEFTFTPSIYIGSTSSSFQGQTNDDSKTNFNFGNIGLVFTRKLSDNATSSGWKSWNFGIGYNRLDNFNMRSFYQGRNLSSSLLDNFVENANGKSYENLDSFNEYLAYYTYLINPDSSNQYTSAAPNAQMTQRRSSESYGSGGETVFAFGGNYSNKFYLGATLGFKYIHYDESSIYEELDDKSVNDTLSSFQFDQNLHTSGSGFDFKMGMIYRANDMIRFGLAFQSPSWFVMHDNYNNVMRSRFDGGHTEYSESPAGAFDYDMTTPFKAIGSLAFVFGKYGLISGDYEFCDYSDAHFRSYGVPFSDVNNLIRQKYDVVHTVRIGTEWLYKNVVFRGGTSFSSSPFNQQYVSGISDFSKNSYSGGIGFKEKNFFFDLGYVYTVSNQYYQPYSLYNEEVPGVKTRVVSSNFTLTMGVKF